MSAAAPELTLGPLLFNWPAGRVGDFYARVADEAPVSIVYLGEVVCGKRQPLLEHALAQAAVRLEAAGKVVVWSTLALPSTPRERRLVGELAEDEDHLIEANDMAAVWARAPRPFVAGPLLNVYSAPAAAELMRLGCVRLAANVELSLAAISAIAAACPGLDIELFGFGRVPLALSGRCAQARYEGLHKDSCRYVCERHPDGMAVSTLEGRPFLAVNGVQTLSHGVQLADAPAGALAEAGVTAVRLSPHALDMVAAARAFRDYLDGREDRRDLARRIAALGPPGELVSGYLHGRAGLDAVAP